LEALSAGTLDEGVGCFSHLSTALNVSKSNVHPDFGDSFFDLIKEGVALSLSFVQVDK